LAITFDPKVLDSQSRALNIWILVYFPTKLWVKNYLIESGPRTW